MHGKVGRIHRALPEELAEHVAGGTVGFLESDGLGHEHVELESLLAVAFAWGVSLRVRQGLAGEAAAPAAESSPRCLRQIRLRLHPSS